MKNTSGTYKKFVMGSIALILVLIGGVFVYLATREDKSNSYNTDYDTEEQYLKAERDRMMAAELDDEDIPVSAKYDEEEHSATHSTEEANLPAEVYADLPDWMPADFIESMNEPELKRVGPAYVRDLRRDMSCGWENTRYKGTFSGHPIVMILTTKADGSVLGKYAYESTLNKYGDVKSSWFPINGTVMGRPDGDGYYSDLCIALESLNPETKRLFEFAVLDWHFPNGWTGKLMNVRHRGKTDIDHYYEISVSADE